MIVDFLLADEQRAIQALAQRIFQDHVTNKRLQVIEAGSERIDRDLWQRLAEASLLGTALPEAYGGGGLGLFEFCLVLEEAGRAVAPVPLVPAVVLAALPIAAFGSAAQRAAYLPGLTRGETLLTAALLEVGSSDPTRPRTTARRDGSVWRLDGEKWCVPIGQLAERILVPARTTDGVGVFLLDPDRPGVVREPQEATNREMMARVSLAGAAVSERDMLGTPEQGAAMLRWIDDRATLGLCAVQLGIAEQALRMAAAYASERKQFGRAIGTFQGLALRAADGYIDVEVMRSVFWEAAWRLTQGLPAAAEIAAAAWWACLAGRRVTGSALHMHGGIGQDLEYPIHRYFLSAKQIELALGGAGKQLGRLGGQLPEM
jgi:alkylation response protein AidB-like acyl-CoA dehydrogenase